VDHVVEAALEIVAPRAREAGVRIALQPAARLPRASGNTLRLEQVFINLILNAIDATAGAGNDAIHITMAAREGRLIVDIADKGPGMSDAVRERLFEPFFTTKTKGESLGLGLSISRTLLEEFGGTLQFSALPEGGTLASVTLPVFSEQNASEAVPA
jgi:two-component system C4-dicarboxylate transport sensor histidine kinase DctB